MTLVRRFVVILPLVLLAACNSGVSYQDSTLGPSLELPPDLAGSQAESKFELPAALSGDEISREVDLRLEADLILHLTIGIYLDTTIALILVIIIP